jgi:hypothetical protein
MVPVDASDLLAAVRSHAQATGMFERASTHEPKNAPGSGRSWAAWLQSIRPVARASGLTATSGRVEFRIRLYTNMLAEPQDEIDPDTMRAVDRLMAAYSADFTLDGRVRNVDLLGQHGDPLQAQAGYLNQDGRMLRIVDITLPLIVNDLWSQAP